MATLTTPYGTVQLAMVVRYTPEQIVNLPDDRALQFAAAFGLTRIPQCPRFQVLSVLARNNMVDGMEPALLTSYLRYLLDVDPGVYSPAFAPLGVKTETLPRWTLIQFFLKAGASKIHTPSDEIQRAVRDFELAYQPTRAPAPVLVSQPTRYEECYQHPNPHESRQRIPVGTIRYQYPVPARLATPDIQERRWRVYQALLPHSGHDLRVITPAIVRLTFDTIDQHFFDGYLMRRITELGGTLTCKLSKSGKVAGSCGKKGTQYSLKMSESIFRGIFTTEKEKVLQADLNIHCSTRLGCWIPTMEHELIHLLMNVSPGVQLGTGPYTPHGRCFQDLAAAIFDHNGIRHFLNLGDVEDVKKHQAARQEKILARDIDCLTRRSQLAVGDAVMVTYKSGVKREIVGKLNPKTVGIVTTHTKNGKPWFFKVPYQFVKKVVE